VKMSRGNSNQARLTKQITDLGYNVSVKHNQIHIEGVTRSPFYPDYEEEKPTYGMTMTEAKEWLSQLLKRS